RASLFSRFLSHDPSTSSIYTLSLHDALPILASVPVVNLGSGIQCRGAGRRDRERPAANERSSRGKRKTGRHRQPIHAAVDRLQRSEEHTSELQSRVDLVCRLLLEKKNKKQK